MRMKIGLRAVVIGAWLALAGACVPDYVAVGYGGTLDPAYGYYATPYAYQSASGRYVYRPYAYPPNPYRPYVYWQGRYRPYGYYRPYGPYLGRPYGPPGVRRYGRSYVYRPARPR